MKEENELRRVAHVKHEATLAGSRIEDLPGCERARDLDQAGLDRAGQLKRKPRGRHARSALHEQRVVQRRAQARERSAHGRLTHAGLLRSHGHAARTQQGVEHEQEIEIELRRSMGQAAERSII